MQGNHHVAEHQPSTLFIRDVLPSHFNRDLFSFEQDMLNVKDLQPKHKLTVSKMKHGSLTITISCMSSEHAGYMDCAFVVDTWYNTFEVHDRCVSECVHSYRNLATEHEALMQKYLHLLQIVEKEKTVAKQLRQQIEDGEIEVERLKSEVIF